MLGFLIFLFIVFIFVVVIGAAKEMYGGCGVVYAILILLFLILVYLVLFA